MVLKFLDLMEVKRQVKETSEEIAGEMSIFNNVNAQEMLAVFNFDEMLDQMGDALAEAFTSKELASCLKFFGSRTGKSVLKKMPDFSEKINDMAMDYVNEKINQYLSEKVFTANQSGGENEDNGGGNSGGNGTSGKN